MYLLDMGIGWRSGVSVRLLVDATYVCMYMQTCTILENRKGGFCKYTHVYDVRNTDPGRYIRLTGLYPTYDTNLVTRG